MFLLSGNTLFCELFSICQKMAVLYSPAAVTGIVVASVAVVVVQSSFKYSVL
jgi:hypothetical protein